MAFATIDDSIAMENEASWEERDNPVTLYQLLSRTTDKFPNNNAVSYQIFSGPTDKAETLSWSQLKDQVTQAANLFRELGIGEKDVVAYVLPNCNETLVTMLAGPLRGSSIRSTHCWNPNRLPQSCAKPRPRSW